MFGADFIERDTEWFAGASFHFIQTALNAAHGINQIFQISSIFADRMLVCFMQSRLHTVKNEFTRKQSQTGMRQTPATEWRPKIAHGETVGINAQINKAPDGAKEISVGDFLPPLPGLEIFWRPNPWFHRGLLSAAPPALGQAGFESHANGRKRFEPVSRTMGSQLIN
jgi:hypothetical protein